MNSDEIILLANASYANIGSVGGKAASLGEMTKLGMPVPTGFVVATGACRGGMSDALAEKILSIYDKLGLSYVAVRSSAVAEDSKSASWAGQLSTYLNIERAGLIQAVESCWDSIRSEHATKYAAASGLTSTEKSVAVVVQAMVNSDISGVLFTANPITNNLNEYLVESAYGLGELLVQGEITPETLVLSKQGEVLHHRSASQQEKLVNIGGVNTKLAVTPKKRILDKAVLSQLLNLAKTIETHYRSPQDIEWAISAEKLYILQSRPITTINSASARPHTQTTQIGRFATNDYILSFWAQGVNVFVTDVHVDAYKDLEALFIIDNGMFKQYFTKIAYAKALESGVKFYSDIQAYDKYHNDLLVHCHIFKKLYKTKIYKQNSLTKDDVERFCQYTVKLCKDYTKMNFEFTDNAFKLQENNKVIKDNLAKAAIFKDEVRTYMNTVLFEPDGWSAELFSILAKQFAVNSELLQNFTQKELIGLFDGHKPSVVMVGKRQFAFVESCTITEPIEGEAATSIIKQFAIKSDPTKTIAGQPASPGIAEGSVKIIPVDYGDSARVSEAINNMRSGQILVAETTAPELMVACHKAGAIITDMGGMLSHAAIVSRELGIPCIVGTQNASKILKDGDIVKVNANIGEVNVQD